MISMSESELAPLRETAIGLMNNVATIERFTSEDDGSLGTIETWSVVNKGVKCRIAESDGTGDREVTQAGRITSVGEHVVRFPYGTDIHESDRIKVRVSRNIRAFEVARVIEHSYATSTTAICVEAR